MRLPMPSVIVRYWQFMDDVAAAFAADDPLLCCDGDGDADGDVISAVGD